MSSLNVWRVPVVEKVVFEFGAVGWVGNLLEERLRGRGQRRVAAEIRRRICGDICSGSWHGIRNRVRGAPPGDAPARALMRELVRLVEMEGVEDVAIGERLELEQVVKAGVVCAGSDEGIVRRDLADGRGHVRLNACPAKAIIDLRLVENLKENALGIAIGVVRGKLQPECGEAGNTRISAAKLLLPLVARVQIDLDGKAIGEHRVDGAIETGEEIRVGTSSAREGLLQRIGIDAKADMIEAEMRDEGDVLGVGVAIGVRHGDLPTAQTTPKH